VDRILGLLSATMGQPDQAAGHFTDAFDICRRVRYLVELAWVLYERAESLGRRGGEVALLIEESATLAATRRLAPLPERVAALRR